MRRQMTITLEGDRTTLTTEDQITTVELLGVSEWMAVIARHQLANVLIAQSKAKAKPTKKKASAKR